jgi:hypothetical protein
LVAFLWREGIRPAFDRHAYSHPERESREREDAGFETLAFNNLSGIGRSATGT